jgi:hypothetical protein
MRPGHRRIFPIKIQKAREEIDTLQANQKREKAKQKREEEDQEEIRKKEKAKQKREEEREELAAEKRKKEIRKREKMQQKLKQEMEDELAKIEMSRKVERARQKGKLNTSIAAGGVESKEGSMAHDTTASADLPSDKLHHAFISHKKTHTAFGDHYEMLSIRLKVTYDIALPHTLPLAARRTCLNGEGSTLSWTATILM